MDISFVRNGQGPPPGGPRIDVVYPKAGERVGGVITSHDLVAVYTHYDTFARGQLGSSVPCIEPPEQCEHCRRGRRRIWKGFLGCWSLRSCRPFIAEITAQASRNEPRLRPGRQGLRGMFLVLDRPGCNRAGRVWATLSPWDGNVDELPAPLNVPMYLYRLWGFTWTDPDDLGKRPAEGGGQ